MGAKPTYYEGQTATNQNRNSPDFGKTVVYSKGRWFPQGQAPGGTPGQSNGTYAPLTPGSDSRTRLAMGLGPGALAQRRMTEAEQGGHNPYSDHPLSTMEVGTPLRGFAHADVQNYDQANKSFEGAMLPVLSGAAVTPSEAQRQIRANLPQIGDSAEVLRRKSLNRSMMLNAAADLGGQPRPFPEAGVGDFGSTFGTPGQQGQQQGPPLGQSSQPVQGPNHSTAGEGRLAAHDPHKPPVAGAQLGQDGWHVNYPPGSNNWPRLGWDAQHNRAFIRPDGHNQIWVD